MSSVVFISNLFKQYSEIARLRSVEFFKFTGTSPTQPLKSFSKSKWGLSQEMLTQF